jgi:hypothetical protein
MKQFIRTTTRFSLRLFLLAGLLAGMLGVKGNLPAHAAGAYYLIPFIDCLWNNLDEPYLNPSVCNPTIQLTPNQTHVFNVIAEGLPPFYRALPGLTVNWGFLGPVGGTFRSSQTVTNYPNGDSANDFTAGMTPGYYVIQASTSDGNIAQFSINIAAPVVLESIDVTPINPSLQTGLTQQFTATGAFSDGSTQDLTAAATWSSSNQSVATISNATSSNGLATVVSPGTTEINASFGAVTGATILTVTDITFPTITIITPVQGATYLLNQSVIADYACQDEVGGSGLRSCLGTAPNGSAIDTYSIGAKSFSVNAADNAGNPKSATVSYNVVYIFQGFSSPVDAAPTLNVAKAGQAIPLKWRVTGANGAPVTNLSNVSVTVASLSCTLGTTTDALEEYASGDSGLQNLGNGYYQFNWKTPKTYENSCKTLKLNLGEGASFEHTALFKFTR